MKKTLTFILLISLSITLSAQMSYKKGYIVKNDQDTLHGFVQHYITNFNENQCSFKTSDEAEPTTYYPGDIKAYSIENFADYQTQKIQNSDGEFFTVFAQLLLGGTISLYQYDETFYVKKNDGELIRLNDDPFTMQKAGGTKMEGTSKKHIGILNYLMQDQPSLHSSIQNTKLNKPSLVKVIEKYNKNFSPVKYSYKRKPKIYRNSTFGVKAGYSASNIKIKANTTTLDYLTQKWDMSSTFKAGIFYESNMFIFNKPLSITAGLNYYNYKYNSTSTENYITGYSTEITINHEETYNVNGIELPLGLKYNLPIQENNFYAGIGVLIGLPLKSSSTYKKTTYYTEYPDLVFPLLLSDIINKGGAPFGAWLSLGYSKKLKNATFLFIEYSYEITNGYSDKVVYPDGREFSIKQRVINNNLMLGIKF